MSDTTTMTIIQNIGLSGSKTNEIYSRNDGHPVVVRSGTEGNLKRIYKALNVIKVVFLVSSLSISSTVYVNL